MIIDMTAESDLRDALNALLHEVEAAKKAGGLDRLHPISVQAENTRGALAIVEGKERVQEEPTTDVGKGDPHTWLLMIEYQTDDDCWFAHFEDHPNPDCVGVGHTPEIALASLLAEYDRTSQHPHD